MSEMQTGERSWIDAVATPVRSGLEDGAPAANRGFSGRRDGAEAAPLLAELLRVELEIRARGEPPTPEDTAAGSRSMST